MKITHDVIRDVWIKAHPDICFDEGSQYYREYKDGCWSELPDKAVQATIIECLVQAKKRHGPNPTKYVVTSVEYLIQRAITKPKEIWDAKTNILVLKSKTLEWNVVDGRFRMKNRKHSREDYATRKLDFDYDPDAEAPALEEIIDGALPNEDSQRMLQEFMGYCLTTHTMLKVMLWIQGPPDSGKTTFLDALVGMLGNDNLAANVPIKATVERFGLSHIGGATLFWSDEQSLPKLDLVGKMSQLVDGGDIMVDRKFKNVATINSKGKVLWVMNKKPEIADPEGYNQGLWTRLNILEFGKNYEEKDVSLYEQAMSEKAGLLNWALYGLSTLLERKTWLPCKESVNLVAAYRGGHAAIEIWFALRCEAGEGLKVRSKTAYLDYKHWAYSIGRTGMRIQDFVATMRSMGFEKKSSGPAGEREFHGFTCSNQ